MTGVIVALCLMLVAQQIFWSYTVQTLINKLMSKSFAEYTQVNNPPEAKEPKPADHGMPEDIGSLYEIG